MTQTLLEEAAVLYGARRSLVPAPSPAMSAAPAGGTILLRPLHLVSGSGRLACTRAQVGPASTQSLNEALNGDHRKLRSGDAR